MKAIEFTIKLEPSANLLPDEVLKDLKSSIGKNARVILLIDEPDQYEESRFRSLAEEQFFQGYAESDAIYDQL